MDWLELKIDTSHAGLDAVTDMLEQQGVTGVMIDDEADFQSFLENNRQYWDYVDDDLLAQKKGVSRVTFYLERNEDAYGTCLLYTSPSPRDISGSRMPSSA